MTADDSAKTAVSDGTLADTQTAISYAVAKNQPGWVVTIGVAGASYVWTSGSLTVTPSSAANYITIQGASPSNRPTIYFNTSDPVGFTLNCGSSTTRTQPTIKPKDIIFGGWTCRLFQINGSGRRCYWLDNIRYESNGTYPAYGYIGAIGQAGGGAGPFGLISNEEAVSSGAPNDSWITYQNTDSPDYEWTNSHAVTWGNEDRCVWEDITRSAVLVTRPGTVSDGIQGAKVLIRHGSMTNWAQAQHGRDSTGTGTPPSGHWKNGPLSAEYTDMSMYINNGAGLAFAFLQRGGCAVMTRCGFGSISGLFNNGFFMEMDCAGPFFSAEGCRVWSTGAYMTNALTGADYAGEGQRIGRPQANRFYDNHNYSALVYGGASCVSSAAETFNVFATEGVDYVFNLDGYTELAYPHPMRSESGGGGGGGGVGGIVPARIILR